MDTQGRMQGHSSRTVADLSPKAPAPTEERRTNDLSHGHWVDLHLRECRTIIVHMQIDIST